jgi:hypothetical protein
MRRIDWWPWGQWREAGRNFFGARMELSPGYAITNG